MPKIRSRPFSEEGRSNYDEIFTKETPVNTKEKVVKQSTCWHCPECEIITVYRTNKIFPWCKALGTYIFDYSIRLRDLKEVLSKEPCHIIED